MKLIILIIFFIQVSSFSFAYEDETTHPMINSRAVNFSVLDSARGSYLKSNLGWPTGIFTSFERIGVSKNIRDLIKDGGVNEDNPFWSLRYTNHFHDPLKPWRQAGFDLAFLPEPGVSSVEWSQNSGLVQKNSWQNARQSFYKALTSGDEQEYVNTFITLGHLTHLISDMAVPAHVRNDSHPFPWGPKSWLKDDYEREVSRRSIALDPPADAIDYDALPVIYPGPGFITDLANPSVDDFSVAPVPISSFWDQNVYAVYPAIGESSDPDVIWSGHYGLAEFTNANFFSQDTSRATSEYPHPSYADSNIDWIISEFTVAEDSKIDTPKYIYRAVNGVSEYKIGLAHYFSVETDGYRNTLDKEVYKDYTDQLLPRAVGYSAALLDYFFRGRLEISAPDRFVYGIADDADFYAFDGTHQEQQFTEIRAFVRNVSGMPKNESSGGGISHGEPLQNGNLIAVAKYRKRLDYKPDLSNEPPDPDQILADFSYNLSAPEPVLFMAAESGDEFTFQFKDDPIPAGITDLELFVVFQGDIGGEKKDAVAVGWKDLMEPTHFQVMNSTEMFYDINTGTLYSPSELIQTSDPRLATLRFNYQVFIDFAFHSSQGKFRDFQYRSKLNAGEFSKQLLLVDESNFEAVIRHNYGDNIKLVVNAAVNEDISLTNTGGLASNWRGTFFHQGYSAFNTDNFDQGIWDAQNWPDLVSSPIQVETYTMIE